MNDNQRHKAQMALIEKQLDDIKKKLALEMHHKAQKWVKKYNLPYRISLDYLKDLDHAERQILINEMYPSMYRKDKLMHVKPDCFISEPINEKYYDFPRPDDATLQRIKEYNKQFHSWDLSTPKGKKVWEYEFTHFLDGYDINAFTAFEMYGLKTADEDKLKADKKYYKTLQRRFKNDPESFRTEEPIIAPEDVDILTYEKYIVDWERDSTLEGRIPYDADM